MILLVTYINKRINLTKYLKLLRAFNVNPIKIILQIPHFWVIIKTETTETTGIKDKEIFMISEELLLQVEKPARYIGNEINMVKKNIEDVQMRFAFCFPDVYEVGMSHLGMQILYYLLNEREDTYCERAFAPWVDMEKILRENNFPLVSLETFTALNKFDFVGFTLQYEMSYTNIINMLDLSNIPILSKDRNENSPIVCAGGPCAYNPEPLADIIDFFYIGEGEVNLDSILDVYKIFKQNGKSRNDFLKEILKIEGVYVPKFYDVNYNNDGTIKEFIPLTEDVPKKINKVLAKDIDKTYYPKKQLVPLIESVHNRAVLELFRGCIRGCRFCQAGYVYRPARERKVSTLSSQADSLLEFSGHEELSLMSLSTNDYTEIQELTDELIEKCEKNKVSIALPSLRIDAFSLDLMQKIQKVRKSGLTFAPEAGSQRLRDVINKNITEENILNGCRMAFEGGYRRVKLYFMLGLPTETDEDILAIAELSEKILRTFFELPKEERIGGITITVSTSCFVPKPFTPFQWVGQNTIEEFMRKQRLLKSSIKSKQIKYNYHDANLSYLEAIVAKGDRKICKSIVRAWEKGARFDAWSEFFDYDLWINSFSETGIDPDFYARRDIESDEFLPWEFIDIGVKREFFEREYKNSVEEKTNFNCREKCTNCGLSALGCGVCVEKASV